MWRHKSWRTTTSETFERTKRLYFFSVTLSQDGIKETRIWKTNKFTRKIKSWTFSRRPSHGQSPSQMDVNHAFVTTTHTPTLTSATCVQHEDVADTYTLLSADSQIFLSFVTFPPFNKCFSRSERRYKNKIKTVLYAWTPDSISPEGTVFVLLS